MIVHSIWTRSNFVGPNSLPMSHKTFRHPLLFLALCWWAMGHAQNDTVPDTLAKPQEAVDGNLSAPSFEKPVYPGGDNGLKSEVNKRLKYPKDALEAGMQGTVMLSYVVGIDGAISDIKVVQGVFPPMDRAAMQAVKTIPPYTRPALSGGKPVPYQVKLPVLFRADN